MGCLSQEIEGTVRRRDGAAGQVCLRERVPGTPQPAGVRPGYKRAISSALLLSSKGIGRKITSYYHHREPYSIGGRNSTTRSDTQPHNQAREKEMEESHVTRKSGRNNDGTEPSYQEIRAE